MYNADGFYLPDKTSFKSNCLLVKPEVGKTRRTTRSLPNQKDPNYRYGKPDPKGSLTAGKVILNWKTHEPNEQEKPPKDFVQLNRVAALNGLTTASEFTKYSRNNYIGKREGQMKRSSGQTEYIKDLKDCRHGVVNRGEKTPIDKLYSNAYQHSWFQDQRQKLENCRKNKVVRRQRVQSTKASEGHRIGAKKRSEAGTISTESTNFSHLYADVQPKVVNQYSRTSSRRDLKLGVAKNAPPLTKEGESAVARKEE